MQANNHQKPKAREKHIHEDPMGREQASMLFNMLMEGEKEGKKKWEGCITTSLLLLINCLFFNIHLRLSIQAILSLSDGHCLVKHCILENVALLKKPNKEEKKIWS